MWPRYDGREGGWRSGALGGIWPACCNRHVPSPIPSLADGYGVIVSVVLNEIVEMGTGLVI